MPLIIGGPFLVFVGFLYLLDKNRNNTTGAALMGVGALLLLLFLFS